MGKDDVFRPEHHGIHIVVYGIRRHIYSLTDPFQQSLLSVFGQKLFGKTKADDFSGRDDIVIPF